MDKRVLERLCPNNRWRSDAPAAIGPAVTWAHVPERGRGLVACADVEAGTILDVAPAVPVREGEHGSFLRQYIFMFSRDECRPFYSGPAIQALVFGPMALCNHSDHPNANVCFRENEQRGLEAQLIARRRVAKGEEVTIRYADCGWYNDTGLF